MTLKTATVIALIGYVIDSLHWILNLFEILRPEYETAPYYAFNIFRLLITNGSLILFFSVLYLNQTKRGEN